MSPALLSKRLKELTDAGVVERIESRDGVPEYHLTERGQELAPIIRSIGAWAQNWIDTDVAMSNLDVQLLMWNMRRNLNPEPMPKRRVVIQFIYPELDPSLRHWWLIVAPGLNVDLCSIDPAHDVDLYVTADLKSMTKAWMGHTALRSEIESGAIVLTGDRKLAESIESWMGTSSLARNYAANEMAAELHDDCSAAN